jgi:hypothetical protein
MIQQVMHSGKFGSTCIIKTLLTHFQLAKPTEKVSKITIGDPIGGLVLTIAAVSTK